MRCSVVVLVALGLSVASSVALPTNGGSRYEALVGGRPSSVAPMQGTQLARIAQLAAREGRTSRLWLDLSNGESLCVTFEPTLDPSAMILADIVESCDMRVKRTRVSDSCPVDSPGCDETGCVAVRWDLAKREAVLMDLFKATNGIRVGCDLSSADDSNVRWGELMLRIVDDIAVLLGIHHVFVADEACVETDIPGGHNARVPLCYLQSMVHGMGYYERFGFYPIPQEGWTQLALLRLLCLAAPLPPHSCLQP